MREPLADAVILAWGAAYLVAAALAPGLFADVPVAVSAGGMALMGAVLLASVALDAWPLYAGLAAVEVASGVASWTGAIRWAVPYDPGIAAVSMAAMDLLAAVVLAWKALSGLDRGP